MTRTDKEIANVIRAEEIRLKRLIGKLARLAAVFLAVAMALAFLLRLSKIFPVFYSVDEYSIEVKAGDTLWKIAEENKGDYPYGIRSYIAEIRALNGIEVATGVKNGQSLKLPIYKYRLG